MEEWRDHEGKREGVVIWCEEQRVVYGMRDGRSCMKMNMNMVFSGRGRVKRGGRGVDTAKLTGSGFRFI